jgi:signal transduction histidine kinase/CheY-like chemotaxis protein
VKLGTEGCVTVVSDRSATSAGGEGLAAGAVRRALLAALSSFGLTLGTALLGLALTNGGLAVLWPAAGMVTGLWLITPPSLRRPVLAGIVAGLFLGNLLAGRPLAMNLMFIAANCGEAWLVGRLLERWVPRPIRIETLSQVGYFIAAVGVAVATGGLLGAALLPLVSAGGGFGFAKLWTMWVTVRGLGMLTVTPAVIALGSMRRGSIEGLWRDGKGTLGVMLGVGAVAYVLISAELARNDLLAFLALLVVVYPFLLWIAARREPVWTYVSLLLITLIVVWRLGYADGLMQGNVQVAQAFLLVSSLWALTLAVVLEQQRRAKDSAQRSERSMRDALAAGRGFTFEYDPRTDRVRRADPDGILAPFREESGAAFFERLLPEDRPRMQQAVSRLSVRRPMYEVTYGSRRPDGKVVWLQERAVAEFDAQGRMTRLQGLTMDITRRREVEEALREADRKKDRFIATLAHELRNPLAPIRTSAELLGSPVAGPGEIAWASKVIRRQVGHMSSLLDDLLDVARITQGKLELRKEWVRLQAVVDTAVEAAHPVIDAHRHQLVVDLPQPAPVLEADPLRLAQVLSNLLTNAAKYSDDGGEIVLAARTDGSLLEVSVTDQGIGIPGESLGSVFEMFAQIQGTSSRSEGGLGIGLSLVKGLVELHRGSITAHSEGPGKGSRFTVRLPCVPAASVEAQPHRDEPAQPVSLGRRILLVDDNRDAADSLALLLGMDGHEVRVAYGGHQALEAVESGFVPELAILDIGLPDLDGYDLARRLRQDPDLQRTTLVALTGWGQEEHKQRAREAGFDHHLVKPVDPDQLAAVISARRSR